MTNHDTAFDAWWNSEHDHSRCWWNWEVGRWICRPVDTLRAAATDHLPVEPELQEQL